MESLRVNDLCNQLIPIIREQIISSNKLPGDEKVMELIENYAFDKYSNLELDTLYQVITHTFAKIRRRHGLLSQLIEDPNINEIMINGPEHIFLETSQGIVTISDIFDSKEELEEIIRNIAADVHREINELNPILDARLANGSRVNAVYANIVSDGPVLTIRKFGKEPMTIEKMIENGSLSEDVAKVLEILVASRYNIFLSGGTSSGKTTFLNALSRFIPQNERVIIIEDSKELSMNHISNLVQMECHNANSMGKGSVNMAQLIKTSLRMRPDRIIVGEVRGPEVSDMLQAMNTGHDGSMSTGHGNSINGMLRRIEAMYLMNSQIPIDAIRAQIIEGIDIMIHLSRLSDGQRKIVEVSELIDFREGKYILNPLYMLDAERKLKATGNKLINRGRLVMNGASSEVSI